MKNVNRKLIAVVLLCVMATQNVWAFCGFYVAKAGTELFNNKSQVILVRDGNKTTITMASDFNGDVKDFAMVVPVPVVLKREDIKVVPNELFSKLDAYSAPRMVEYYDYNPCEANTVYEAMPNMSVVTEDATEMEATKDLKKLESRVTIEARYSVDEYDILILSAKESGGLKSWLTDNGYSIPDKAEEVLEPYIKNNMKFFVVKVNLEKQKNLTNGYLRPLQIKFEHERFMLPIRLGMANAKAEQDMIVYTFSRYGRIETTNYRTVKVPSDRNVPLFVQQRFDKFYADLFKKSYKHEGRNAVFLEYAWNLSPSNYVKCDPCVGEIPDFNDMVTAGADWLKNGNTLNQNASVFFTRLHVRYTRDKFPQDLMLMETRNQEHFQGRYIITHPATGSFSCDAGQTYLTDLHNRRQLENQELAVLTGWNINKYGYYPEEFDDLIKTKQQPKQQDSDQQNPEEEKQEDEKNNILPIFSAPKNDGGSSNQWQVLFYISLGLFVLLSAYQMKELLTKLRQH